MKEELEKELERRNTSVVPFLVGTVVGAGIALLLAPKAGRELRSDLKDFTKDAREKISSVVDKTRDLYAESKTAVTNAVEAGKNAYIEEKEKHRQAA